MLFLAVFASSDGLDEFRRAELVAAADAIGLEIEIMDDSLPFMRNVEPEWFCIFKAESGPRITELAHRCILLRGIYTLFRAASLIENLHKPQELLQSELEAGEVLFGEDLSAYSAGSYHYKMESIGKKYSRDSKVEIIDKVNEVRPHAGEVDWSSPDHIFYIFIHHKAENTPPGAKNWVANGPLLRCFHCVLYTESLRCKLLQRYDLKSRLYIGTTSMPPQESLLMANVARIRRGDYVMDPFSGTGSLLIAAAHFGARTLGTDTDGYSMRSGTDKMKSSAQMNHQRRLALASYTEEQLACLTEEGEREFPSYVSNFKVYHLPLPDRVRMNFSTWSRGCQRGLQGIRAGGILDAIVTDPPYGIREPRRKVVSSGESDCTSPTPEAASAAHYQTNEVVVDLALFAAEHLVLGGHLAFWHPTSNAYTDDELPTHPSLEVILNIPQRLSLKVVRRLVVMRKTRPLPSPPPTREECAPRRAADNLRGMVTNTNADSNAEYASYRSKVERRREASRLYREARAETDADTANEPARRRRRKHSGGGPAYQEMVVANREKKRQMQEKQRLAAEHNAELARMERQKHGAEKRASEE